MQPNTKMPLGCPEGGSAAFTEGRPRNTSTGEAGGPAVTPRYPRQGSSAICPSGNG